MKPILHVIDSLGRGGAERQLVHVVRCLTRSGTAQAVLSLFDGDDLVPEIEAAGVRVEQLGLRHSILRTPAAVGPLRAAIARVSPVLVSTQLPYADALGRLAARDLGLRTVSTWQDTAYESGRYDRRLRIRAVLQILRRLEQRTIQDAAGFLAVSHAVRDSYCRVFGIDPGRCTVLPNMVECARYRPRPARPPGTPLRLVHAGRHVPQKGLDLLLEAVATLDGVHLVLYGHGPETPRLRRLCQQRGISGRVEFRGVVSDLPDRLAAADAFVFPSHHEGLPLAYIEALAAGLPVVASRIPSNCEVDPDAAATLFFESGETTDLAQALDRLRRDPAWVMRASDAAPRIAARFDVNAVGPRFQEFFAAHSQP